MGERMAYLKKFMDDRMSSGSSNMCVRLHELFCSLPRYTWNQISDIPFNNGIYIVFEKGENYNDMERIVRVGTHISSDRLKTRLTDHFIRENHDGSIFRKNVGKAILNIDGDSYLENWTIDTSKVENRIWMDKDKNKETERRVSEYMRENFSFTVFQVDEKEERLRMEEGIIATLNAEPSFVPSSNWFGTYSPEKEIYKSGMWLKRGLNGMVLSEDEFKRLLELCGKENSIMKNTRLEHNASKSHGKYIPLFQYFKKQTAKQIVMTYEEIEDVLGFKLPNSAYNYVWWWNPKGHNHCQAWLQAGYTVEIVNESIRKKVVTFNRIG